MAPNEQLNIIARYAFAPVNASRPASNPIKDEKQAIATIVPAP